MLGALNLPKMSIVGRDLTASIVVFLVAMPLCMGIAVASGVPPEKGLITGIIGGIVVGALAGSPLQVSGPGGGPGRRRVRTGARSGACPRSGRS